MTSAGPERQGILGADNVSVGMLQLSTLLEHAQTGCYSKEQLPLLEAGPVRRVCFGQRLEANNRRLCRRTGRSDSKLVQLPFAHRVYQSV